MTDLAALVVRMQADNSQYIKALDQATAKLNKFSKDQQGALSELGNQFSDLANKFAAGFAIDKIVEFTASSIESAAAVERLSQVTGISTESLSSLRLAAAASGLSADEMGVAYKKLNVSIEEAAGNAQSKAAIAFKSLGISVTDANGQLKNADQILPELADKFQSFADGPNKVALAVAILGKQGQNLIPVLNQGSAGLDDFRQKAQDAGLVISGELAASAEEFAQKAAILKASLVDGLAARLATQLLPVLNTLVDSFGKVGSAGSALDEVASGIVFVVKAIAAIVIETSSEFKQFGESIGAVAAAANAAAHGRFSEAADIWQQSTADNEKTQKDSEARILALYQSSSKEQTAALKEGADANAKAQAPNLAAAEQAAAAVKKLQDFAAGLREQANAFGLGGAAAVRYKLQVGPLADDLKKAGEAGQAAAKAAIAFATALQTKTDTKTVTDVADKLREQVLLYDAGDLASLKYKLSTGDLGKAFDRLGTAGQDARAKVIGLQTELTQKKDATAISGINDQLDTLQGNLAKAAAAAFDLQNRTLSQNLTATNDQAGLSALQNLKDKTVAQAAYNEEVAKASVIQQNLASTEAQIALLQSSGAITELQAQAQLEDARAKALDQLTLIANEEQRIADVSGLPKLVEQTQAFKTSLMQLATQQDQLTKEIRSDLENSLVSPLTDAEMGTKSLKAAFSDMIKSIEKDLLTIANKNIAESLFGSTGSLGGLSGGLAGLLGGAGGGASALGSLFGAGGGAPIAATGEAATGLSASSFDDLLNTVSAGGLADGGRIPAGQMRLVGENGPELAYSGSKDMQIQPISAGGKKVQVTNHFTVQSQNGTISRQSQMQMAAEAARQLSIASRRNN